MQREKRPLGLRVVEVLAALSMAGALGMVLGYAPLERTMGIVQKVFYFHVAANWLGMLSFIVAAVAAVGYLVTRDRRWDTLEVAAVEIGLAFALMGVVSGSIWARPIWNTWWTWDPRLTTVTIMLLVYVAYFMLRQGIDDPDRRARFGAVYALVGMLSVPLTFFSVRLYRTIHPVVVGKNEPGAQGAFDMTVAMRNTLFVSLFAFTVLYVALLWHRYRLGRAADQLEETRLRMME